VHIRRGLRLKGNDEAKITRRRLPRVLLVVLPLREFRQLTLKLTEAEKSPAKPDNSGTQGVYQNFCFNTPLSHI